MATAQHKPSTTVAEFFKKNAADGAITAAQLAELVSDQTGVERDPKTVRGHLRTVKARNQAEYKNATWKIDRKIADATIAHYAKAKKVS